MTVRVSLHGGPVGPMDVVLRGVPPGKWPDFTCVQGIIADALPHHYRHVAAGVYEYQGACAEFDHEVNVHQARCADCGAELLGHPEKHQR